MAKFAVINHKVFSLNTFLKPSSEHFNRIMQGLMILMCSTYVVYLTCAYAWWSFWFWVSYCSEEYRAFLYTTLLLKSVSRTEVKCQEWKTNSKMFWWFPLKKWRSSTESIFRWSWSLQVPFLLFLWTWYTWYTYI